MRNESADLRNYPNEDSCFYYAGNCNWLPEADPMARATRKDWMVDTDIESFMSQVFWLGPSNDTLTSPEKTPSDRAKPALP